MQPSLGEPGTPAVHLVGSGAVLPEVLAAAEELAEEGSPPTSSTSPRWTGSTRPGSGRYGRASSGSVHELYELHDLLPDSIVNAALAALSLA